MSTSFLYHAFQIEGVNYNSTAYEGNHVILHATVKENHLQCPSCSCKNITFKGKRERRFHLPPIGQKHCFLALTMQRIFCEQCNQILWVRLPFMKGKSPLSRSFIHYALDLLTFGTIKAVADHLAVGWDCIKDLHKDYLKRRYKKISLRNITYISIDEFAISKGHEYMTVISDHRSGAILHVVRGKDKNAVIPFLKKLRRQAHQLKGVSMDMSRAFYAAVKEELPHVAIVFDHFHVMQLMTRTLEAH